MRSSASLCLLFSGGYARHPRGIPGMRKSMRDKVREGNSHCDWMADVLERCERGGLSFWLENPDTSWWWRQRKFRKYRSFSSVHVFGCCFCRFGTMGKTTRLATIAVLLAAGWRMMSSCSRPHLLFRGICKHRQLPWTLVAQPYRLWLCMPIALCLCVDAGWAPRNRFNLEKYCKSSSVR